MRNAWSLGTVVPLTLALAGAAMAGPNATCRADLDGDGQLTVFDFLEFQNLFGTGDLAADFDGDGALTVFDFLEFQNEFDLGCPAEPTRLHMAGVPLDAYPYFEATRAFNTGDTVYLTIDPDRFPGILGASGDIYIVASKTEDEWISDPSLIDVRGMPQEHTFDAMSIENAEVALVGSEVLASANGLNISSGYDIVVDLDGDGELGEGDYVDGLGARSADRNGFSIFTNLADPGPLTPVIIDSFSTEGELRLNYPAELSDIGPLPIVIIIHGGGHDYRWYDYLQNHLASWGWVSISISNDFSGSGERVLRQTDALIAEQDTIAGGVLNGLIDSSRIVWIGHSLGGREVNIAAEQLHRGLTTPNNYTIDDIILASAIAANSSGSFGFQADPGPINFHMIWGSSDGDISGGPGSQTNAFRNYDRARGFKHSTYVHGADHNDFNCCGFNNFRGPPATEIGRAEAQQIAKATWLALVKHYGEGNGDAIDYLTRPWDSFKPLGVTNTTTLVHMYRQHPTLSGSRIIDDFQTNPSLNLSSSDGSVAISTSNTFEVLLEDTDGRYTWTATDPANGMNHAEIDLADTSRSVVFDYDGPASLEFEVVPALADVSEFDHLSFRACQGTRHPLTTAELAPLTFHVTLIDSAGVASSIHIGSYGGGIEEPYQRIGFGVGTGWQNEFSTVRLRLSDFLAQDTGLDLTNITAIRFDFGQGDASTVGRLGLDEIEFTVDP